MSLLYSLFIIYILLPKVDLIPIGGSAIRVNDLVYLAAMIVYLQYRGFILPRIAVVWNYALVALFALVPMVLNHNIALTPLLYVFRVLQYASWAFAGFYLAPYISRQRFSKHMALIAAFLFVWAVAEALGYVPKLGKFVDSADRVSVNTSGPFEISVIAAFLMFLVRSNALKASSFAIILLAQARVTAASVLLPLFRRQWVLVAVGMLVVIPLLLSLPLKDMLKGTRFATIPTPTEAVELFDAAWDIAPDVTPDYEHINDNYQNVRDVNISSVPGITDLSFEIRVLRWLTIAKAITKDNVALIFGFGPSAWGAAVDGYYVRLVGEGGIVGLALFCWVFWRAFRDPTIDYVAKEYLFSLLVTAIMIDIFTTDKPMSLFWFYLGYSNTLAPKVRGLARQARSVSSLAGGEARAVSP